jgi:O-antigen/teichoic acid export membrane protein
VGLFYPLHALNLNMLQVQGHSRLFLRLEIIKKILAIPVIVIGVFFGIKIMIVGMIVNNIIAYFLNSYWSGRFIGYSFGSQLKDILPSFLLSVVISMVIYMAGLFLDLHHALVLVIQILAGAALTAGICEWAKFRDYLIIKEIIVQQLHQIKKRSAP